jgi:hypothetical protein
VDQLAGRDFALDGIEEANEFAAPVALHAAPDDRSVKHAERGEQGCRAMALVIVRHGLTANRFDRQPGQRAVEGLDLALFVKRVTAAWAAGST